MLISAKIIARARAWLDGLVKLIWFFFVIRYIIVIDGLETTGYWNNVLSACPDNNKSNRIIVTTASNRVTNTICQGNGPVYKMRPLDKNSAKHLLGKKVMFPRNVDRDRLMTMILETCEYLPLAISNMGDYMRSLNKTWDYDECEKACTDIGSLLDNNEIEAFRGMKHVVNRSYHYYRMNLLSRAVTVFSPGYRAGTTIPGLKVEPSFPVPL